MSLKPFFLWCDKLPVSAAIRDSAVIFPAIETVHLLALTVLLGSIVLLSLRLMGKGLAHMPLRSVGALLSPFIGWGLTVMLVSGILLFLSEAEKCYDNPPFFFKMEMLALSIVFHWTVVRRTLRAEKEPGAAPLFATGVVSLILWFGIGVGGRAIGFY